MNKSSGAAIACCTVLVGFVIVCGLMVTRTVQDSPSLQILLGGLIAMGQQALSYFTGSTASSKAKDRTIASVATQKNEDRV
jgi:hypothetical protein